jgi:hypothetical protein
MSLTATQRGVLRGILPAVLVTIGALCASPWLSPASAVPAGDASARLAFAVRWTLLPVATLILAVARMAMHRFFTPADIDGSGLTGGTPRAHRYQAVLQNIAMMTK